MAIRMTDNLEQALALVAVRPAAGVASRMDLSLTVRIDHAAESPQHRRGCDLPALRYGDLIQSSGFRSTRAADDLTDLQTFRRSQVVFRRFEVIQR